MKKRQTGCPDLNRLQDAAGSTQSGKQSVDIRNVLISTIDVQDIADYVFKLEERVQLQNSFDLPGGDLWALANILKMLVSAREKHPHWLGLGDPMHGILIVAEECGEAAKAVVEHIEDGAPYSEIEKEIEQTAAACIRFLTKR